MQGRDRETHHPNMIVAGVDVAKLQLDLAFWPAGQRARHANDAPGRQALIDDLKARGIVRLGLEASGGYERLLVREARAAGIDVVVFQPAQVKAYAVFIRRKAKTDRLDAALIAECTARTGQPGRPQPPGYAVLAEIMTRLEQIEDDLMRAKTRRDAFTCKALKAQVEAEVARCKKARDKARAALIARVEADPDIKHRFDLILSVPGIGPRTALAFLLRMPEIGSLDRAEAAALAGLAPFDDQSGDSDGLRHIKGGRARLRKSIYMAALPAACRHNPQLVALYNRLVARGKRPKIALVACARKLTIFVNAVIARGTPWQTQHVNPNGCSQ